MAKVQQRSEGQKAVSRGSVKSRRAERWIAAGCLLLTLGIVLSLADTGAVATSLVLGGFLLSVAGLHLLGRSGREPVHASPHAKAGKR